MCCPKNTKKDIFYYYSTQYCYYFFLFFDRQKIIPNQSSFAYLQPIVSSMHPPPLSNGRPFLTTNPPSDRTFSHIFVKITGLSNDRPPQLDRTFWSVPWSDRDFGGRQTRGGVCMHACCYVCTYVCIYVYLTNTNIYTYATYLIHYLHIAHCVYVFIYVYFICIIYIIH